MSFSRPLFLMLLVVSVLLSGCLHKHTVDPITFSGPNGLVLKIKKLPEGVEEEDISIVPLAPIEMPLEDPTGWAGYSL